MTESDNIEYTIVMTKKDGYKFEIDFGKETIANLLMDEPKEVPGGEGKGPNASMLLATAVGHCLSASLTFCLTKKRVELKELRTKIRLKRERNDDGFWRILKIDVDLEPIVEDVKNEHFLRCSEIFRNYCIVSSSIESGIPINVNML